MIEKDMAPKMIAETLNRTADAVTKQQIRNVKTRLTVRTPFTLRSMEMSRARPYRALNKASGKNLSRMFSRAGTVSKYLWMQEGFTKKGQGGGPIPIARDLTRAGGTRSGIVRRMYRLSKGASFPAGEFGTSGKQFVGRPKGGNRPLGLYERRNKNTRLMMLRSLTTRQVQIKDTNFHDDAVRRYGTRQFIAAQFRALAKREISRRMG